MLDFRLKSFEVFKKKSMPNWGADLSRINFDDIYYYAKPTEEQKRTWEDVPEDIKETFDRIGIPEAEKKFLAGVGAQYDSEVVYHNLKEELEKQGVIFCAPEEAVRDHPELVKKYFGTVIPYRDNKFAALNSAVWSGGSFVYVPPGIHVDIPLQAYFRINSENFGQFERTLIIADKGSFVHYVEGCTAPVYTTDSLHSAVVEIIALEDARVRYSTIQNWVRGRLQSSDQTGRGLQERHRGMGGWQPGIQADNEVSLRFPQGRGSPRGDSFHCLRRRRAGAGYGGQGIPHGGQYQFRHYQQVHKQGRGHKQFTGV